VFVAHALSGSSRVFEGWGGILGDELFDPDEWRIVAERSRPWVFLAEPEALASLLT
jgi:hypothetical protein